MELKLYNTLTARKEAFTPLDSDNVRMYVCGPTVYDYAHIGNARPVIVFDVLYRLLRHVYGDGHVTYVRNITDVDDKINARAAEEGVPISEVTARTTKQFHDDIAALGVLPPDVEPRATAHIEQMKALIEQLVKKGNAYVAEDHVLFDVPSMPDYGKLSKRSTDEMEAGARVEVAPYKKDAMDFVLWKPSKDGEPGWDSPCGIGVKGRPGWHIECSAMSAEHLGETFDIHGGGVDLVFPHHENEIAQSRCAHGTTAMAQVWMHNGYLQVEGQKMSKSLGNFITIRELLTNWNERSWPGDALRFNMLRSDYKSPLDWTFEGLSESQDTLRSWYEKFVDLKPAAKIAQSVIDALCDDLNTPSAISELHELANQEEFATLLTTLRFLGFSGQRSALAQNYFVKVQANVGVSSDIKADVATKAYVVRADRSVEFDGETQHKIDSLISKRNAARAAKDFAEADRIRDEIMSVANLKVRFKDSKDPVTGEVKTVLEIAR